MEGITIVWEESGGVSVVATQHWIFESDGEKVSVALTDAGLSLDPLGGDRPRAERFVRSILEADLKQIREEGVGESPGELNYQKQEDKTQWRRSIGPGKLADLPDSDRTVNPEVPVSHRLPPSLRIWRELVNLHAPEE